MGCRSIPIARTCQPCSKGTEQSGSCSSVRPLTRRASIRSTSSGDVETLWIGGTNETTSVVDLGLEVVGTDVERTLMWVGDVTATGIVLPDEASDMTPTTFPVGYSILTANNAGFFSLVLYDGSDDDGGDGDGCDGDLNGDGMVDGADLTLLLGNWGVCP